MKQARNQGYALHWIRVTWKAPWLQVLFLQGSYVQAFISPEAKKMHWNVKIILYSELNKIKF